MPEEFGTKNLILSADFRKGLLSKISFDLVIPHPTSLDILSPSKKNHSIEITDQECQMKFTLGHEILLDAKIDYDVQGLPHTIWEHAA